VNTSVPEQEREYLHLMLPELFQPCDLLYIGASFRRLCYYDELISTGARITLLEADSINFAVLRAWDKPVILGDVRACPIIFHDRQFDIAFWWHGPEHVPAAQLPLTLRAIESITKGVVVTCGPFGSFPQGDIDGNQYERHVATLAEQSFDGTGYTTKILKDGKEQNIIAWKRLIAGGQS